MICITIIVIIYIELSLIIIIIIIRLAKVFGSFHFRVHHFSLKLRLENNQLKTVFIALFLNFLEKIDEIKFKMIFYYKNRLLPFIKNKFARPFKTLYFHVGRIALFQLINNDSYFFFQEVMSICICKTEIGVMYKIKKKYFR